MGENDENNNHLKNGLSSLRKSVGAFFKGDFDGTRKNLNKSIKETKKNNEEIKKSSEENNKKISKSLEESNRKAKENLNNLGQAIESGINKGLEKAKEIKDEAINNAKIDSGYDIFSEENTKKIEYNLSSISILLGNDIPLPLDNNNEKKFLGEKQQGKLGDWVSLKCTDISTFLENSGVDNLKNLGTAFKALGKYQDSIIGSQIASKIANTVTFGKYGLSNEQIKSFNNLLKPKNIEKEGGLVAIIKTEQQKIINQNLSAFKGEENAPKTIKINGTVFSPQEIAEAIGGDKSLNEFINKKDELFKQSEKEDKSEYEKEADVIRGRLSGGLALLGKYSDNLDINKLSNLLETCEKDFGYFDKNKETNFFKDLENLKELEQKIQQEKERQEREKQEKERQEKERQEKERQEKERQERQEINSNIKNLKKETEEAVNREKQRQQQLLNQAKVNTCNKLYNGVEGKETNPVKSFDGKNFYKDETNTEQTEIKDAKLGLENEKLKQYNNRVKNFPIQLEGNIKNSKDSESLKKNEESIGIMGKLSNNARQLNEEEDKIEGEYDKTQESLDYIKKKVQKNLLLLNEYSQNTSKEFNITQEEIKEDIEGKTIEDIEKKLEELKKEREEIINDFIKDCEKVAKEIDTNKKENDEKIAEIRNDINNIDDSDINSFNEETKKNIDKLKDKNFFKGIEGIKIDNFEDYGLDDIDREIAKLEKQKELVQERNKAVAPKEPTPKSPTVESKAAEAARILNDNKFGRFASNGESFTENDMMPENFERSIRPILEEFNENFKEYENKGLNKDNQEYKMYRNSVRMFDKNVKEEDIRVYFNKNNVNSYDKENKDTKNLGEYDTSYQNYIKNKNQENENDKNHASTINKIKIGSSFETSDKNDIDIITTFSGYGARTNPVTSVGGILSLNKYMEENGIRQKKEENKKDTIDRDIPTQPEPIKSEQSTALDDELNKVKLDARNDLSKIPNPNAEMANNFHDGKFYKDKKELSTDKSNIGINNTDNALDCIIEQNEENIKKSKNKEEVEEAKKNTEFIKENNNKLKILKEGKDDFDKRHTEAQENLKQISDIVDKNLKSFNEFCDNSKKEVENSTKEINETENNIIKTEAEANKRAKELEEERQKLIEEFNKASEKSKKEIEEKQSSNDKTKKETEEYVKSIGNDVSKEKSLQENLESLKKDNIDEKIEMTKAEFSKDQEIPNFEDYKNRINEIDQHLAGLEKIKENLRQQEQENQEIDQPEPEPREIQQPEPETDINSLRLKFFNGFNELVDKNTKEATLVKISDDEKSISYANESGNIGLKEIEGKNRLKGFAENINKLMGKDKFLFSNSDNNRGQEYTQEKIEENLKNTETTLKNKEEAETIESNFDKIKDEVEGYKKRFDEKFEDTYKKIVKADINENIYDNLSSPEEINKQKEELAKQKEELEKRYNEYKAKINEKSEEINKKETNLEKNVKDIEEYTDPESINPLLNSEHIQELNELLENFKKTSEVEGLNTEELKKFEADIAEIKAKEEVLSKVEEKINQKQQDTAELNLDEEVKAIANTKENSKDELIENNVKLEDKCEQIYKQKGIENDKEKQYDVKCEELQKSVDKLSDDQKKQYSERMEEIIGYSLDMSVNKEKREKIDIDLCEKQRLYITKTKNCDGKVADNIKDAGVGVKVTDLSENYRRTVGQKSVGLVATVEDIDPKEFYKDGEVPKDVDKFNFARFEVQSIAEDEKDEYKGYKIDLKLPKDKNTVDIMADIRELGFEKAMEKYKDAGLEVNIRDKDGNLLSEDKQKEFFEKLQPKSAEKSIGLEKQKQKMNNESLNKEEREKARKEFEEIMKIIKEQSIDDTEIKPIIQANKKDPFPKMQNNDISKTLPSNSNFRVPSKNNNKNGGQNMSETENKNNLTKDQKTIQKKLDDNGLHKNDVSNVNNFDPKTPLSTSQTISAGQGHGQNTNQNVNLA